MANNEHVFKMIIDGDISDLEKTMAQAVKMVQKKYREMNGAIGNAEHLKQVVDYISQIEAGLAQLGKQSPKVLQQVIGSFDKGLQRILAHILDTDKKSLLDMSAVGDQLGALRQQYDQDAAKNVARTLNALYKGMGEQAPFKMKDILGNNAGVKSHMRIVMQLNAAYKDFLGLWAQASAMNVGSIDPNMFSGGSIEEFREQLQAVTSLREELTRARDALEEYQATSERIDTTKVFDAQGIYDIIKAYEQARKAFAEFSGDKTGNEYKQLQARYVMRTIELMKAYGVVSQDESEGGIADTLRGITPKGAKRPLYDLLEARAQREEDYIFGDDALSRLTDYVAQLSKAESILMGRIQRIESGAIGGDTDDTQLPDAEDIERASDAQRELNQQVQDFLTLAKTYSGMQYISPDDVDAALAKLRTMREELEALDAQGRLAEGTLEEIQTAFNATEAHLQAMDHAAHKGPYTQSYESDFQAAQGDNDRLSGENSALRDENEALRTQLAQASQGPAGHPSDDTDEDIGDLARENGLLEDKLELLQEIANAHGSTITKQHRASKTKLDDISVERDLTPKEQERYDELTELIGEAEASIAAFGQTYEKIILRLANGKKVKISPNEEGLRALQAFADEGYGQAYKGIDIEDIVFVRRNAEATLATQQAITTEIRRQGDTAKDAAAQHTTEQHADANSDVDMAQRVQSIYAAVEALNQEKISYEALTAAILAYRDAADIIAANGEESYLAEQMRTVQKTIRKTLAFGKSGTLVSQDNWLELLAGVKQPEDIAVTLRPHLDELSFARVRMQLADEFARQMGQLEYDGGFDPLNQIDTNHYNQVLQAIKDGTLTTVEQCIERFKALCDATKTAQQDAQQATQQLDAPSQDVANTAGEVAQMEALRDAIREVEAAINDKTAAFRNESSTVSSIVEEEIAALNKLKEHLETIRGLIHEIFVGKPFTVYGLDAATETVSKSVAPSEITRAIETGVAAIGSKIDNMQGVSDVVTGIKDAVDKIASNAGNQQEPLNGEQQEPRIHSLLASIQTTLEAIQGILRGFTGIDADNKDSIEYKKPVAPEAAINQDEFSKLSYEVLGNILTELQSLVGFVQNTIAPNMKADQDAQHEQPMAEINNLLATRLPAHVASEDTLGIIKEAVGQLSELVKTQDDTKNAGLRESLQQLITSINTQNENAKADNVSQTTLQALQNIGTQLQSVNNDVSTKFASLETAIKSVKTVLDSILSALNNKQSIAELTTTLSGAVQALRKAATEATVKTIHGAIKNLQSGNAKAITSALQSVRGVLDSILRAIQDDAPIAKLVTPLHNAVTELKNVANGIVQQQNIGGAPQGNPHYVTNPNGRIIPLYRGLHNSFGGLVTNNSHGTFWSDSLTTAKGYAGDFGKVEKAFVALHNPLEIDAMGFNWDQVPYIGSGMDDVSKRLRELFDSLTYARDTRERIERGELFADMPEYASGRIQSLRRREQETWQQIRPIFKDQNNPYRFMTTNQIADMARAQGHDGVIFKNIVDSGGNGAGQSNVVTAFAQEQIHYIETIPMTVADAVEAIKREFGDFVQFADVVGMERFDLFGPIQEKYRQWQDGEITEAEYTQFVTQNALVKAFNEREPVQMGHQQAITPELAHDMQSYVLQTIDTMQKRLQKVADVLGITDIPLSQLLDAIDARKVGDAQSGKAGKGSGAPADTGIQLDVFERALELMRGLNAQGKKATLQYSDDGRYTVRTEEALGGLSKKTSQTFGAGQGVASRTTVTLSNEIETAIRDANALIVENASKVGNADLLQQYNDAYAELIRMNQQYGTMDNLGDDDIDKWNKQIELVQRLSKDVSGLIVQQQKLEGQQGVAPSQQRLREYQTQAQKAFDSTGIGLTGAVKGKKRNEIRNVYDELIQKISDFKRSNTVLTDAQQADLDALVARLQKLTNAYNQAQQRAQERGAVKARQTELGGELDEYLHTLPSSMSSIAGLVDRVQELKAGLADIKDIAGLEAWEAAFKETRAEIDKLVAAADKARGAVVEMYGDVKAEYSQFRPRADGVGGQLVDDDGLQSAISAYDDAYDRFMQTAAAVREVDITSEDGKTKLTELHEAKKHYDACADALQRWLEIAERFERNQATHAISGLANGLAGEFRTLDFRADDAALSDEQSEIAILYQTVMDTLAQYKTEAAKGMRVDTTEIDTAIVKLRELIQAYKAANNIGNARGASRGKTYGTAQLQNFTAKKNSLVQGAKEVGLDANAAAVKQLTDAYDRLVAAQKAFRVGEDLTTDDGQRKVAAFKAAQLECNKYARELGNVVNASKQLAANGIMPERLAEDFQDDFEGRRAALIDYVNTMFEGKATIEGFKDGFNKMTFTVKNTDGTFTEMTASINAARTAIVTTAGDTKKATSGFMSFISAIGNKMTGLWSYVVARFGVDEIVQAFRTGINYVREIDSALTELKKVTDETDASYDRFLQNMSRTAGTVGSTVSELTTMAAEWARLGYSMEESAQLAESTAILLNVSEFSDATAASEALISTMQAFGYAADESAHVVDILNEVGNNFAVSSDGLATALQDSASALMEAGNNLEQSVALIAAANKVVNLCHVIIVI